MTENAELVREFLTESGDGLDLFEHELGQLASSPASEALLNSIFRTIHNIKGAAGFLGFAKLESLTHAGEGLLSLLRDRRLGFTPEIASGLLALADALRSILARISATGDEGAESYSALTSTLTVLNSHADLAGACKPVPLGRLLVSSGSATEEQIERALKAQRDGDPRHLGEILVAHGVIPPGAVRAAIEEQAQAGTFAPRDRTVRVEVGRLDQMMRLAQGLDRVQADLLGSSAVRRDPIVMQAVSDLGSISAELREGVSKARTQSLGAAWNGLRRMVGDFSARCGKRVRFETEGRDIELDKTILEAMKDPMIHILRNAVDHGIETPKARAAAGKSLEGRILLRASRDLDSVVIEIIDDGAGVSPARVKQRAVERGLLTAQEAADMADNDAVKLVFLPGVSTAASATNVSGRGVGMDVVRTNIEKVGGTVEMESTSGSGSCLTIRIPDKSRPAKFERSAGPAVQSKRNQPGAISSNSVRSTARVEDEIS